MALSTLGVWTLVCLVYQFGGVIGAPDNRGTEFIIGYMENIAESINVELFVTTMRTTTVNVRVTAPRYSSAGINEAFSVTAGTVKQLFFHPRVRLSGNEMSSKAVLISADDEVVIYGVNKERYSCDAFLGLPTDVLGTEYYAVTYYPPSRQCELLIVGVNDSTSVSITPGDAIGSRYISWGGRNYYKGNTLTVTMNRFDTFQLVTYGDLTGTYISSTKAVSVFSGNRKTNIGRGGSSDHLVEHLTNVDTWGKRFVTVPVPNRSVGDYFKFIASESSTSVTISGGYSNSFTLSKAGSMVQKTISSRAYCLVESDKPILVVQFCLSQQSSSEKSDPMMMIIPPVEQYGADYTFTTPKYSLGSYSNYFMFIIKESEKSGLRVDGNAFPSSTVYNRISGTDYVGGYISVSEGSHTVRHTSPISIFGGYLYGQANYETYGFTTGMRMAGINTVCIPTSTVVGDGIDNDCDGLIDEELCTTENQGRDDDGDGQAEEDCATPPPIDGGWSSYSSYGACSLSCRSAAGGATSGIKTQTRYCNNPTPKYDGKQCSGSATNTATCTPSNYCPIDGSWGSWGSYGSCSVTCGSGSMTKTRQCNNPSPAHGGSYCSSSGSQTASCTLSACPIDGGWSSYGNWGSCSRSCGTGLRSRTRQCNNPSPANNGADCVGSTTSTEACNTQACPIDGGWSSWGSYGSCSVTCAGGLKYRTRSCSNPSPQHGGASCGNSDTSSASCNTNPCPIDGGWSSYGNWGSCSRSCGTGSRSRTRQCNSPAPAYNGADCVGSDTNTETCNTHPCPIDGGWTSWGSYGSCSVTCAGGLKSRTRSCTNPAPQHGGASCGNSDTSSASCNTNPCPIDGEWSSWGSYGSCSVTCAGGVKYRTRSCTNPAPQYGGASCGNADTSSTTCNTFPCPIDGVWGSWGSYAPCTLTCKDYGTSQTGTKTRTRSCDNPAPQYNGADCPNSDTHVATCTTSTYCPINGVWSAWNSWNTCSVTCASGVQHRSRTCTNPPAQYGGLPCSGSTNDSQVCTLPPCPIDGAWSSWSAWGSCTVTCGGGTATRGRSCTNPTPQYGGAQCSGNVTDTMDCNTAVCIIDGDWAEWNPWGTCTISCGNGTRSRIRSCSDPLPLNGGLQCPGASSDFSECNTQDCPVRQAGVYQQLCPANWFTCESGQITCIDRSYMCDCANDCDDGSDETEGYAGCNSALLQACGNGADGVLLFSKWLGALVLSTIWLLWR
ncbi:A disintegrin and metalloproteinase with thrombospondin motifs adt-1-like [Pecten maximus]|uniref:A disintegrin and metalloproteinase with thrombospondin motifs adt-1-like n=1 Tax=Pecten maximus TaxID=6579 RepID=UPI001457F963|nr:A disintegrin and metalloproteinase with thrombospondin motifs adt-1-like [Pecten maximus]